MLSWHNKSPCFCINCYHHFRSQSVLFLPLWSNARSSSLYYNRDNVDILLVNCIVKDTYCGYRLTGIHSIVKDTMWTYKHTLYCYERQNVVLCRHSGIHYIVRGSILVLCGCTGAQMYYKRNNGFWCMWTYYISVHIRCIEEAQCGIIMRIQLYTPCPSCILIQIGVTMIPRCIGYVI